jgi:uncharacterized protein (DUF1778 family)
MTAITLRDHRVQLRVFPEQRERIKRASSMLGMSMSSFIASTCTDAATNIIRASDASKSNKAAFAKHSLRG